MDFFGEEASFRRAGEDTVEVTLRAARGDAA